MTDEARRNSFEINLHWREMHIFLSQKTSFIGKVINILVLDF